jgi:hypothetical protein
MLYIVLFLCASVNEREFLVSRAKTSHAIDCFIIEEKRRYGETIYYTTIGHVLVSTIVMYHCDYNDWREEHIETIWWNSTDQKIKKQSARSFDDGITDLVNYYLGNDKK